MVLPAGFAPATVSFEASRADLLRYGSVSYDWKLIRPRATELILTPPFAEGLPLIGRWPGIEPSMRNWMPHLESHQDLRIQSPSCYCCTTGQVLRTAVNWRGPTTQRQSDHDLSAMLYPDGISFGSDEAQSPRIISSAASEPSQRAGVYFVFIGVNAIVPTRSRRLLDGLAGSSYLKREDAAIGWYLAPWMTSWLWVKKGCGPVALRFYGLWNPAC
jgi:hypothetical protein